MSNTSSLRRPVESTGRGVERKCGFLTILKNDYRAHFKAYEHVLGMFLVAFGSKITFQTFSEAFEINKSIFFGGKLAHMAAFCKMVEIVFFHDFSSIRQSFQKLLSNGFQTPRMMLRYSSMCSLGCVDTPRYLGCIMKLRRIH